MSHAISLWHWACLEREGNGTIGADDVGNAVRQDKLQPIYRSHAKERVPLIDQVEHSADNERDVERASRNTIGHCTQASLLPPRHRSPNSVTSVPPLAWRPQSPRHPTSTSISVPVTRTG